MSRRKEFLQVQQLIVKLSKREFDKLPELSGENDMLDALIENLVMLGEELNVSTVSKEYFQDIFNSVPDIILILNYKGEILTGNTAMNTIKSNSNTGGFIKFNDYFENSRQKNPFTFLRKSIMDGKPVNDLKLKLKTNPNRTFNCKIDRLYSDHKTVKFLALLTDVTELENYQSMLIDSAIKYRQLFTDSSDGIFLFNLHGKITEHNDALNLLLKRGQSEKESINLSHYLSSHQVSELRLLDYIKKNPVITNMEVSVKNAAGSVTECLFSCTPVYEKNIHTGFQGMLKNISQYREYNSMLMRAMSESQEKERKRIATDLHDSLGQQLSGVKFMLGSLASMSTDSVQKSLLLQMNADIFQVIEDLRKICFDLMPGSLDKFGLIKTIEELLSKLRKITPGISFQFEHSVTKKFSKEIELNIYRITQEFLNNSLKYSGCKKVKISLIGNKKEATLQLKDDGIGLETKNIKNSKGMGLNNILSRARSFNGTATIQSKKNKGTTFIIKIPLNK